MCEKVRHSNLATDSFQTISTSPFTTVLRLTVFTAVFSNKNSKNFGSQFSMVTFVSFLLKFLQQCSTVQLLSRSKRPFLMNSVPAKESRV